MVKKPSRSDEVMDPEQQVEITDKVKAQFDSMAPKRPIKPNRSEPDPDSSLAQPQQQPTSHPNIIIIPEFQKLLFLKSADDPQQVVKSTGGERGEEEEFVETEYYKQLESIDKLHHTTGTGFIKATKGGGENGVNYYKFKEGDLKMGPILGYRSNPATNDWIPSVDALDQVEYVSTKPSRSG